ncbi:lactonase family protein [Microbacterium sp. No. 7]|uniref:lactonase family protein n=1 Tax=Microbacterium sp. No. 7 TaxID=1714373 RepID=UPI0006CF23F1|nr:beta-propeller fold lactonase family protein [Microbacterium sp. No. 7]ALJ18516.1 3-carboxymuconate cyclase [Microbacterium sp. No. 7]
MRLLVGGYTAEMRGRANGIGVLHAGAADDALAGGALSRRTDAVATGGSPSWLTRHPSLDVVYAAMEGTGEVQAFRRTGEERYSRLGMPVEAGAAVCHVAVAPDGSALLASCWGDGRVVRMPLNATGIPSSPHIAPAASDPHPAPPAPPAPLDRRDSTGATRLLAEPAVSLHRGSLAGDAGDAGGVGWVDAAGDEGYAAAVRALRDAAGAEFAHLLPDVPEPPDAGGAAGTDAGEPARVSRAHQAVFLPGGLIATTDLGFDLVRFWRVADGRLVERGRVVLPLGSGPRHMVWHPSGHLYVVTELSLEVFVLAPDAAGAWRIVAGTPLAPATLPGDAAAELAMSRDGEVLYAGVRGSDTIAVLRVRGTGAELAPVALVEAGVAWPRHHVVLRDTLLVAGQHSDEVASRSLDLRTGIPGRVRFRAETPSPSCLLPVG